VPNETKCEGQASSTPHVKRENEANPIVKPEEGNELHIYSAAELSRLNQRELLADIQLLDGTSGLEIYMRQLMFVFSEQLKRSKLNMAVLKEYQRHEEEFLRCAKDLDEMTALRDAEKQKYDSLRKQQLDKFMAGFSTISLKLKEMYQVSLISSLIATTE